MTSQANQQTFDVETARKVLAVVDKGLTAGLGTPEPGKMCVEAAICYALGLEHGDDPGCVAQSVRNFKIRLNDADWPSEAARAKGLRALAVAQLGSLGVIDDVDFNRRIAEKTIRVIVPIALRSAATVVTSYAPKLEAVAQRCETEGSADAADAAAAAAYAAAYAAGYADHAAYAAAYAAARAADAAYAAGNADYAANAAGKAADAAYAAGNDKVLTISADIALDVLRELNVPGVALWDAVNAEMQGQ